MQDLCTFQDVQWTKPDERTLNKNVPLAGFSWSRGSHSTVLKVPCGVWEWEGMSSLLGYILL